MSVWAPLKHFLNQVSDTPHPLDNGCSKALSSYSCPLMALRYSWSIYSSSDWKHCQSTDISWALSSWAEVNFLEQWAAPQPKTGLREMEKPDLLASVFYFHVLSAEFLWKYFSNQLLPLPSPILFPPQEILNLRSLSSKQANLYMRWGGYAVAIFRNDRFERVEDTDLLSPFWFLCGIVYKPCQLVGPYSL